MSGHPVIEEGPVTYTVETRSYYEGGQKKHTIDSLRKVILSFEESLYLRCLSLNKELINLLSTPNTIPELGKFQIQAHPVQSLRQMIYPPPLSQMYEQQLHLPLLVTGPRPGAVEKIVVLRKETGGRYHKICKDACFIMDVPGPPREQGATCAETKEQRAIVNKLRQTIHKLSQRLPLILGNGYPVVNQFKNYTEQRFSYQAYFGFSEVNGERLADMFDLYFDILTPAIPQLAKYINSQIDRLLCQEL